MRTARLAGGVVLIVVAAASVAVLVWMLINRRAASPGPAPPTPANTPAAPAGSVVDATAYDQNNTLGVTPDRNYLCVGAAASTATASGAALRSTAPTTCTARTTPCPIPQGAPPPPAPGDLAECGPAPTGPGSAPGASHPFPNTSYGYCTGVPGASDSMYSQWVAFYDDPRRTGATFAADPETAYNRVGNVTGAGCFVSPDEPQSASNYSRSPYLRSVFLGDEAVLFDMLSVARYPAERPGFPRLTPVPVAAASARTFGPCDPTAPTPCTGATECQLQSPAWLCDCEACQPTRACDPADPTRACGPQGKCTMQSAYLCAARPPCDTRPCDPQGRLIAPVSAVPLADATFAPGGGYDLYLRAVHKIWGFTQAYQMGGVNSGNVYPYAPLNQQGPDDAPQVFQPGDPMYGAHVLRHRIAGDYAPIVDPNLDRDGLPPPAVPNALDKAAQWSRPKGYESSDQDEYDARRAQCSQCGAGGPECFSEIQCAHFPAFGAQPKSVQAATPDGRPILDDDGQPRMVPSYYTTPPQMPSDPADNPAVDASGKSTVPGRRAYPLQAGGPNPRARCGGCSATAQVFGPGRYTARARIRPTTPQSDWLLDASDPVRPIGRGYVFAMWTFAYTEIYALGADPAVDPGFVPSDQATTTNPCWDDCTCLQEQNYCTKDPGSTADTCCDPRTARTQGCATPKSFSPVAPGLPALYCDAASCPPDSPADNITRCAECALVAQDPGGSAPRAPYVRETGGSCYLAAAEVPEWTTAGAHADESCATKPAPVGGQDWQNAGPCLRVAGTLVGGRPQPYPGGAGLAAYDLKIRGRTPPPAPYSTVCSGYKVYGSINSEIDIEIPSNSPQADWKTQLTFRTMNANTWAFDVDSYSGYKPIYTQAMVQAIPKSMPAAGVSSFVDDRYHDYMVDWYVDQDHSKSYVAFYFDGQLVYSTTRIVPTRSGRLLFGLWPGWWGTGRHRPDYDFGYCDLAGLIIEPYTPANAPGVKIRTMPQTYDQVLPAGVQQTECCPFSQDQYNGSGATECAIDTPCEVACDFRPIGGGAAAATRVFACVDGVCRPLAPGEGAVGLAYVGDPLCGGACGTCVGCVATPPLPSKSSRTAARADAAAEMALLLVAIAALVGGALLLALKK